MDEVYVNLLSTYGPVAVFLLLMLTGFGIPLGEDLVVIPAGILIAHGDLNGPLTAACAYLGVLGADFLWFAICHQYGTPLLHKRWFKRVIHPRRLLQIKHELERRGTWVIVMARFIPGTRTPAITSAGVLHLAFWKFALAEAACCLVTVPLQLSLGYGIAVGVGTEQSADLIRSLIGGVVLILAILICLAWWRARHVERRRLPRAKAAWLRRFRVHPLRRQR